MIDYLIESEKNKEQGNAELKNNQFEKAVECYSKAIELAVSEGSRVPKSKLAVYYANRSFANIKL
jgi:Flp pilus assembly protein TadD